MFGSKFWEEIFGEQILLNEKKNFFWYGEEIFGTKFWRRDSCEEEISPAKIFWRNFCKLNFNVRRNMESKNVWQQILGRKNLGSKFFWVKIRGAKWGTNFF